MRRVPEVWSGIPHTRTTAQAPGWMRTEPYRPEQHGMTGTVRAVFARHAASLLLLRQEAGATQVLMGVRDAGHRFMPNRLVFPGGAVDPSDAMAPAAAEPDPAVLAMLGRNARPRLARALVMAAARELQEETGLSFGTPPSLDGMDYLCRAVTPPRAPIRFNARFLLADAGAAQGTMADTREMGGLRYYGVEEALALDLALPTRQVLLRLQDWLRLPPAGRRARTALDVFKLRRWHRE